jgi:MFS family permease
MLAAAFSMARAESGILGPVQGWLTDRLGPRVLIRIGMTVFGVGFLLFSQVHSPVPFFLTFFMMALGSSLGGFMPIGVAIVRWFRRRRTLALGLSATGMSIGGLLTQLVAVMMIHLGWRWAAFVSGVLILAIGVPLAQLVRASPEASGERPDGDPVDDTPARISAAGPARAAVSPAVDFTAREALRTRAFWYIGLGHGAALLAVSAISVHLIVHVTERLGYSLQQGAAVIALMTVLQVIGQISGGWAGDRFSKRLIATACMMGHAVAMLLLASATTFWMVLAFAVLHGLSWGVRGPLMSGIRADYFGAASFGSITGMSSTIVMFGMMGGPVIAGLVADWTGSYDAAFRLLAAFAAIGGFFFLFARRPRPPRPA